MGSTELHFTIICCDQFANLAIDCLGRAMISGQTYEGRQSNVNYATKLLRTYTAQIDAFT